MTPWAARDPGTRSTLAPLGPSSAWSILLVAAAYFTAQRLSLDATAIASGYAAIGLGLGVALAAVILYGCRMAGGVLIGAALYHLSVGAPLWVAALSSAGESLAVLAVAVFLERRGFDPRLRRVEDIGMLMAAGILGAATVVAGLQVFALAAGGSIVQVTAGQRWVLYWTAAAQGVLIATPLLLSWLVRPRPDHDSARAAAIGLLAGVLMVVAPVFLVPTIAANLIRDVVIFAFFPIALWVAHRFTPREASLVNALVAGAAILDQALSMAPFGGEFSIGTVAVLHGFVACFALTTLTFSANNVERRTAGDALVDSETRFRSLTEMANDWYWEQDPEHRFTFASSGVAAVGVDRSALVGKCLWELPFEASSHVWVAHRKTLAARRPFRDLLLSRPLPSGEVRHFLTSGDPVFDRKGTFTGYRGVVREITAEKWAEEALRESEQRYASVFLNSAAAILVVKVDHDGLYRIESCNQAAEALFDIAAHGMIGATPEQCFTPEVATDMVARFKRCLTLGSRVTEEHEIESRSGAKHVVETLVPIRREPDRVERVIVIAIDISEQRRVEQRARESEQLFTRIFHASPAPIAFARFDDGRITEVNAAWTALFGFARERAIGRTVQELGIITEGPAYRRGVELLLQNGSVHQHELTVHDAYGRAIDILYSGEALELGGETVLVSTVVDVTARKRNEEAMRRSQESLSKVFHASPVPMLVMEYPERRYIDVNDAWVAFFGFTREEAIGRSAYDLRIWPDPQKSDESWTAFVSGQRVRNHEQRVRKKSGDMADVLISAELIELDGEARVITSIIDITARKMAERQLRESERRFRDFSEAAGEYVWETHSDDRYSFVSQRIEGVTGFKPEELIGRQPAEFMPPGEAARVREWLELNRRPDGSFRGLEHRSFTKSGASIWQLVNAVAVYGEAGKVVGHRGTALDITERKLAEQRIEELATRDPLTGLPNRRLFEDQLVRGTSHAQRTGQLLALMFIDLDKFKSINDTLGHQIGDGLLKEVARRLSAAIRKGDTLSRFGGDEFVILLEGIKSPGDAGTVAQKIVAELSAPCEIDGHKISTSCSIGLSVFPNDATDISTLMRCADAAMYAAKAAGRDTYRFFSADMHGRAATPSRLGFEIRIALDRDEFRLLYQPRVRIADDRVTAVQAQLRWRHPQRGLLPGDRFMKTAEDAGLAQPVTEWALERAIGQVVEWRGLPDLHFPIVVNFFGLQLSDSLIEMVKEALSRHRLDPRMLQIELSEAALMRNIEEARTRSLRLREMGVKVIVDDFGTGYSSVQYLRRVPVDGVKIGPAFVRDLTGGSDHRAIVRALIEMARNLDVAVIADGVETEEQLEALTQLGCIEYCGAHYLPPVPPVEFEQRVLRDTNISRLKPRRVPRATK
jgi:diguanylate cyclase (GGDEF)-like protein/PAS domain S-box-containing protein